MSWNTSAILIHSRIGDAPEQCFASLGASGGKFVRSISFDEAASSSLEGLALAVVEGWTLIFDPVMFMNLHFPAEESPSIWPRTLDRRLLELSREQEVVSFLLFGVSGTSGFAHFIGGERKRVFLYQQGEQLKNVGAPSTQEQQAFAEKEDEEQAILSLIERLSVDWDKVAEAEFALFQFDES